MLKTMRNAWLLGALAVGITAPAQADEALSTEEILQVYADDYSQDPSLVTSTFGIKVGEEWFHIHANRHEEPYTHLERFTRHKLGPHEVVLHTGQPEEPTFYFELANRETLDNFYSGFWNAGTAAMQTYGSDQVPLEIGHMDGADQSAGSSAQMYHALSHFWSRGVPEISTFSRDSSLPTHGISAVSLYMMKNNRIAWFSIGGDEVANETPGTDAGEMPNLFIITKGRGVLLTDTGEVEVKEGMSVFVPPFVKHTIYNPYPGQNLEGVLVLFGDNSDYAYGTSYPAYLEDYYTFLGNYEFRK